MANIWITGAHGFIGKHLAKWLGQGHVVVGLGHGAWPEGEAAQWGVSGWLNGEIQPSNLQHLLSSHGVPDVVYHLAGGSSVGSALASPHEDFSRTVVTTAELLEWMRSQAPQAKLVAVSSAAVYGGGHAGPISEDARLTPYSPYGYHKLMMEELCHSYSESFGMCCRIIRLFSVYGPWLRKQLLWDLCSKLEAGADVLLLGGTGSELRDWIEISDAVRLLDIAGQIESNSEVVLNGGTGVATPVSVIAKLVVETWGAPVEIEFSGQGRRGDPFCLVSRSDAAAELGFRCEIAIEQGIANYVNWFKTIRA